MTAIIDQSQALMKERYGVGLPKLLYSKKKLKYSQTVKRRTDFGGKFRDQAVQNENPQGIGPTVEIAQGSMYQGNYLEWNVYRRKMYGTCRIQGEALRAVKDKDDAFAALWRNEGDGTVMQLMEDTEIAMMRDGTGVIGRISSTSTVSTATITLEQPADIVCFKLNMRLGAVSVKTLSPTVRAGSARVTALDRKNGTVTVATTWSGEITGLVAGDYLVRYGFNANAGTPTCIEGFQSLIAGGTSPGTLFGLNRNLDPVRLAGQVIDASDQAMDEAVIEACGLVAQQGGEQPTVGFINPRNMANWKKSHQGRIRYDVVETPSRMAKVSFKGISIEGDDGEPIVLMTSPFQPINEMPMVVLDDFLLDTLGEACGLADDGDGAEVTRMPTSDTYETRFVTYGNHWAASLMGACRLQNFGTVT
jgi:hypothetical protein